MAGNEPSRVTDEDESSFVFEVFGPRLGTPSFEREQLREFLRRVQRDVQAHPDDYRGLGGHLVWLTENYARTMGTRAEFERRLTAEVEGGDQRAAAAALLRRIWRAQLQAWGQV